ncbi:MAG: hypothetical protein ACR2OR_11500 [Hyphomicrobiales bacterium]
MKYVTFGAVSFCLLSASIIAGKAVAEEMPLNKCEAVFGSYVTSISDIEGVFQSRGLVTFSGDGVFLINDSGQGGVEGIYDPFSASQGAWTCAGGDGKNLTVKAVGLNFTLPRSSNRSGFGRVDYEATYEIESKTMSGTIALRFSGADDLESADPVSVDGPPFEEFRFSGNRIVVK